MADLHPILQLLALILGPTGAAWAGIKVALNGTVKRVERIESKVDDARERLARIEGQHTPTPR